jgi:hypothetical protein
MKTRLALLSLTLIACVSAERPKPLVIPPDLPTVLRALDAGTTAPPTFDAGTAAEPIPAALAPVADAGTPTPAGLTLNVTLAGLYKQGAKLSELKGKFPGHQIKKGTHSDGEGDFEVRQVIDPQGEVLFEVYTDNGRTIDLLEICSPKIRTRGGIHAGSRWKDLKAKHKVLSVHNSEQECRVYGEADEFDFRLQGWDQLPCRYEDVLATVPDDAEVLYLYPKKPPEKR